MTTRFALYRDYGCSDTTSLADALSEKGRLVYTDAAAIIDGRVFEKTDVLVIGGGAATPYFQKLNGTGNDNIRHFVKNGGAFLGICAGAYYACTETVFEKDVPQLCVTEKYALNLLNAHAVGTLHDVLGLNRFSFHPSAQTVALLHDDNTSFAAHYYGGPFFDLQEKTDFIVRYDANNQPAVVFKHFGKGKVVLSGVHVENTGNSLKKRIFTGQPDENRARQIAETLTSLEDKRLSLFDKIIRFICD